MDNYFRILYYLNNLMKQAYMTPAELTTFQNLRLRRVIKYAYEHSSFYHDIFRNHGIKPEDIKNASDLNKLPILKRETLQKNLDKIISNEFLISQLLVDRTSGSSGQPLFIYLSKKENEFRKAKMLRANISCGQRPKDRWLVITAPRHITKVGFARKILGVYVPISISVFEDLHTQLSLIDRINPNVLEGYSSSLILLAEELKRLDERPESIKLVIGGAELIDEPSRKLVEDAFQAPFFDQYASVELEAMAWQCERKENYHIDADSVIMQFVDEEGEEVAPGESGEIVCTSLFNYAMPFIRYAIGDVGKASEEECSCGRCFPVMKMVEGRKDSFIRFSNGRVFSPRSFTITVSTFSQYNFIDRFRIIQKRKDSIEFLLKIKEGVKDKDSISSSFEEHVRKTLKLYEPSIDIKVHFVEDISLSKSGKLSAVVSECK